MKNNIIKLLVGINLVFSVCSCEEKDLYDPTYSIEKIKAEYLENFIAKFGDVSNITSWDFSSNNAIIATRADATITTVEDNGLNFGVTNTVKNGKIVSTFSANTDLQEKITSTMSDETKHEGEIAILTVPSNSFTVYPLSIQGAYKYDLYVRIKDGDNILIDKNIFSKDWEDYSKPYFNGMGTSYTSKTTTTGFGWNKKTTTTYTVDKTANMGGCTFTNAPVGATIEIYLKFSDNSVVGTVSGNAIVLDDIDVRPEEAGETNQVKYIGIEDSNLKSSGCDFDYNDLIIALIGNPYVPQPISIVDNTYTIDIAHPAKRYMIEDLGASDDFDFNDIVVDVEDVVSATYTTRIVNGATTDTKLVSENHNQKAHIRALGGTKDFTLCIGNVKWKKSDNFVSGTMYNTVGDIDTDGCLLDISINDNSWLPDENNVKVIVGDEESSNVTEITFGEAGQAPLMIATDEIQPWSGERENATWIKDYMKK